MVMVVITIYFVLSGVDEIPTCSYRSVELLYKHSDVLQT